MYEWEDDSNATMVDRKLGAVLKTIYGLIPDDFPKKKLVGRLLANIVSQLPTKAEIEAYKYAVRNWVFSSDLSHPTIEGKMCPPDQRVEAYFKRDVATPRSVKLWGEAADILCCYLNLEKPVLEWEKTIARLCSDDQDYRSYLQADLPSPGGSLRRRIDRNALQRIITAKEQEFQKQHGQAVPQL